jgi:hypothetical protein
MNRAILSAILVLIVPWILSAQINWTGHLIGGNFEGAYSVYAIDLDGDGDVDVLGAAYLADDITWWENDGSENFTQHTIADNFDGAYSVYAIDLDGDEDIDVLGMAFYAGDITWWENDGNQNFTEHTIADNFDGASSVYAIDLDGDEDFDVLGAAFNADDITWWENDGSENFTQHTIADNFDGANSVYAIDLDGDLDIDVLGSAQAAQDIIWWENDGGSPPNFTEHMIIGNFHLVQSVYAIDLDGDEHIDVLGAAAGIANDIAWWQNDGSENFTKIKIADNFDGANSVYAIDLDGDEDIDVLGTAAGADDITWWENDGSENFTEHTIADNFDGANSVYAIDLDGDEDIDVLGTAVMANAIIWWESDLTKTHDVSAVSIDIPSTVPEDTILNPHATVANFGDFTDIFNVTCTIEPGSYISTTVSTIAPDESIQVTFPDGFQFEEIDSFTVTVYTRLLDDINPANDTLVKIIETYDPGVTEGDSDTPVRFSFCLQNNPAHGHAVFNLALPEAATVRLTIYDVSGRLVDEVLSEKKTAGYYSIPWTKEVSAGIFFYRLDASSYQEVGKLVIVQ